MNYSYGYCILAAIRTEEETLPKTVAEMIGEAKARIETVSPKDAADQVAAGKAVFLDVREPVEWEHHIEGAVQVPRGLLEFVADPASPSTGLSSTRRDA